MIAQHQTSLIETPTIETRADRMCFAENLPAKGIFQVLIEHKSTCTQTPPRSLFVTGMSPGWKPIILVDHLSQDGAQPSGGQPDRVNTSKVK